MHTDPLLPTSPGLLAPTKEDRTWGTLVHLSAFVGMLFPLAHIIVPLVIWLMKREGSAFVNDQGREAVNAQITLTIYLVAAMALWLILIGIPLFFGLVAAGIILPIVAAVAANDGKAYRYPFILRLIK